MLGPKFHHPTQRIQVLKNKKPNTKKLTNRGPPFVEVSCISITPRNAVAEGVIPYSMRFAADGASPTGDIGALVGPNNSTPSITHLFQSIYIGDETSK